MSNPFDDAAAAFAEDEPKPRRSASAEPEGEPSPKASKESEEERRARLAELDAKAEAIQDGVYFGLDMDVYQRVRALGSGSLCDMLVSPATFWADSWLNPARDDKPEKDTAARMIGRAYHAARLEPETLMARFCRQMERADLKSLVDAEHGICWTGTDIGRALGELGATKKRGDETVLEQAKRLEEAGYKGLIWPLEEARWKGQLGGRVPIPADHWEAMLTDMERIHKHPDIAPLLYGGAAEVSIFWTDQHGLRCKARLDYLRPDSWTDFKTFENSRRKVLRQALAEAMRYNRYYVQAVHYRSGVEAMRAGGLQLQGEASDTQRKLLAEIQMRPEELACWYIFQEKGGVPNLLAYRFPFFGLDRLREGEIEALIDDEERAEAARAALATKTGLHIRGLRDIDGAKREFALYSQVYRPGEPWQPLAAISAFEDADFNHHWLEGTYE